jgi:hypothetical protein
MAPGGGSRRCRALLGKGRGERPATLVELLLLLAVLVCFGNRSHLGNLLIFNQFYLDKVEINTKFGKGEC